MEHLKNLLWVGSGLTNKYWNRLEMFAMQVRVFVPCKHLQPNTYNDYAQNPTIKLEHLKKLHLLLALALLTNIGIC